MTRLPQIPRPSPREWRQSNLISSLPPHTHVSRCAHTYTRTGPGCIGLVVHSCFMFIEDLLWPKMNKGWFKHVSASTLFRTNVQKNPRDNRHFLIREIRPKERRPIIRGLSSFSSFLCSTQNHHLNGKLRTDLVRRELNPKMGKEIVASTWIL